MAGFHGKGPNSMRSPRLTTPGQTWRNEAGTIVGKEAHGGIGRAPSILLHNPGGVSGPSLAEEAGTFGHGRSGDWGGAVDMTQELHE